MSTDKFCVHSYDKVIPDRLVHALDLIEKRKREIKPGEVLNVPAYHFFRYRGFNCGLVMCTTSLTQWVGYVRKTPEKNLLWPKRSVMRPFSAGIDFQIPYRGETLVGFHLYHLIHDVSVSGVQNKKGTDYMVCQLREFIDMCLKNEKPVEIVIPHLVSERIGAPKKKRAKVK